MIRIERVRMQLPAGFEHRATSIAQLVGRELAKQQVSQDISLESLAIPRQEISLNTSDTEIANMIVEQIVSGYGGGH
jgi:hypothetical protein